MTTNIVPITRRFDRPVYSIQQYMKEKTVLRRRDGFYPLRIRVYF